jgi:hypothetical protein
MSVRKAIAGALVRAVRTVFVWIGSGALITAVNRDPLKPPLYPEVSSDSFLSHVGGAYPAKTVNEMLRPWGDDQVLLVVASATSIFSRKIYYELLILGSPRRVPAIICEAEALRAAGA